MMNDTYRMTFEIDAYYKDKMFEKAKKNGLTVSAWLRVLIIKDLRGNEHD